MTGRSPRRAPAGSIALPVLPVCLAIAVISGLVWMHALSGGHHLPGIAMLDHAPAASSGLCTDPDPSGHCPDDQPKHPVCQSTPVTGGITITAPGPAWLSVPPASPHPVLVSAATAATEAGAGTGCGPPSLTMLSTSRT